MLRLDKFYYIPNIIILERLAESRHTRSRGAIFDYPEHLTGGNGFHGFSACKVSRRRGQNRAHLSGPIALVAMAHFTRHRFGGLIINNFTVIGVGAARLIALGNMGRSGFGFPGLGTLTRLFCGGADGFRFWRRLNGRFWSKSQG